MKRPASMTFLLSALVLLITGAGLFSVLVPVVRARSCSWRPSLSSEESMRDQLSGLRRLGRCEECGDGLRITLAARLLGKSWWEGREVGVMVTQGLRRNDATATLDRAGIRLGIRISRVVVEDANAALRRSGEYESVEIDVTHNTLDPKTVKVVVLVTEK